MDKKIIFAVAGSGKTTLIISKLNLTSRFIVITYTNNNVQEIKSAIIKKFGYVPCNIKLISYFVFLHSFCYKPFLSDIFKSKGITYKSNSNKYCKRSDPAFFINSDKQLYSNRIALMCDEIAPKIKLRLEKYYDSIFVDEVQDFDGRDFNLLKKIIPDNCEVLLVGDFFQHTFGTSKDGNVNINLYKDYSKYKKHFEEIGLTVDTETLIHSHRCSKTVCEFVQNEIGITISSASDKISIVKMIDKEQDAYEIIRNEDIVKLFYQDCNKYDCRSMNWGDSKGLTFKEDVCVVLNKATLKEFKNNTLKNLKPTPKRKLYVACTRTEKNLFFVPCDFLSQFKIADNFTKQKSSSKKIQKDSTKRTKSLD